jgi:hypothetical protein
VRALCLLLAASPVLLAQDAREILRRSIELERKNQENWINYTYLERQLQRQFDSSDKLKSESIKTYDVTNQEGSPYRRLVARNDKPLSPEEQKAEEEKLQRSIEERRHETKEQRDRRVAEWRRRQEKQREPINELVDAFDLRIAGEENLNGRAAWIIDGTPHPGYKPKSVATSFLPKMKARFWISKADNHWIKMDAETLDTVTYGALLIRIAKGAHITLEQTQVPGDDVWLPKRIALKGAARILLVKSVRAEVDFTYSDYRKFQTESRVVSVSPR